MIEENSDREREILTLLETGISLCTRARSETDEEKIQIALDDAIRLLERAAALCGETSHLAATPFVQAALEQAKAAKAKPANSN